MANRFFLGGGGHLPNINFLWHYGEGKYKMVLLQFCPISSKLYKVIGSLGEYSQLCFLAISQFVKMAL